MPVHTTETPEIDPKSGTSDKLEDANANGEHMTENGLKLIYELANFAKENGEAVLASSRAAMSAAETLRLQATESSRRSFDETSSALRTLLQAKAPSDIYKVHSDLAKSSFEFLLCESARLREIWLGLAREITEPIATRYSDAAKHLSSFSSLVHKI